MVAKEPRNRIQEILINLGCIKKTNVFNGKLISRIESVLWVYHKSIKRRAFIIYDKDVY